MAASDDGQAQAIIGGKADLAAVGSGGTTAVPVRAASAAQTETFVSGTAKQLSTSQNRFLYINITTAAALAITMGPTSAATTVPVSVSQSSALGVITLFVPAGWYVKITGTVGNLVTQSVAV